VPEGLIHEELIESGHVFKQGEIASAFEPIEQRRNCGKVVLVPDP